MRDADLHMMDRTLQLARTAADSDEVPVGAVLVGADGALLAEAGNRTITDADPTAHAEVLVLRRAAAVVGNYRLPGTTLYVSIEPCVMCLGAMIHARVARLVYGALDPKWGAVASVYRMIEDNRFNHRMIVTGGLRETQARKLMQDFFRAKRNP